MDHFIKVDFFNPIQKNLIKLCKLKTFTWAQYLNLNTNFKNSDKYYLHYENANKYILFTSLEIDAKKINYHKLILKCNSSDNKIIYYFVYKILIDYQIKNYEIESNNYTSKNDNTFIYPYVITFFEKRKIEEVDNYLTNRIYIDIKCLFKMEFEIKKIILITENHYKQILDNVSSIYCTESFKKNRITYDDITFFFFYHPVLMPLKDIYGFEYHNINYANLKDIDILFKIVKNN